MVPAVGTSILAEQPLPNWIALGRAAANDARHHDLQGSDTNINHAVQPAVCPL